MILLDSMGLGRTTCGCVRAGVKIWATFIGLGRVGVNLGLGASLAAENVGAENVGRDAGLT
jgi:hypothetical protein